MISCLLCVTSDKYYLPPHSHISTMSNNYHICTMSNNYHISTMNTNSQLYIYNTHIKKLLISIYKNSYYHSHTYGLCVQVSTDIHEYGLHTLLVQISHIIHSGCNNCMVNYSVMHVNNYY